MKLENFIQLPPSGVNLLMKQGEIGRLNPSHGLCLELIWELKEVGNCTLVSATQ
jgi:hypothetical protein